LITVTTGSVWTYGICCPQISYYLPLMADEIGDKGGRCRSYSFTLDCIYPLFFLSDGSWEKNELQTLINCGSLSSI
jgi:hypothetical protein